MPLAIDTRKTDRPVKISGIIGESFEICKVLKLQLKHNIQVEGILVPYMAINPATVKRPLSLKQYDIEWALAINQHHQGHLIAQVLLGTDCAQYLPVAVTNEKGYPIQTKKARLKHSLLTGNYILFGSAKEGDQ